jgi:peptidoglycan/xylan/chitin deacetylase (PgdA/CDA1 family)
VVLTFDDGWQDVLSAVPILNRHGFKATFLSITGAADGVFGNQYLTWPQIEELAKHPHFEFGSHTLTHPWDPDDSLLTWLEGKNPGKGVMNVMLELRTSKAALECHLARAVTILAWSQGQ